MEVMKEDEGKVMVRRFWGGFRGPSGGSRIGLKELKPFP